MRILIFVSVLGILVSIGVLILVIIKSNKANAKDKGREQGPDKG